MSYEGSEEHLCEVGHRWTIPCQYGSYEEAPMCPEPSCGHPSVWFHGIDDTNCDAVGYIPETSWEGLVIDPGVRNRCGECQSYYGTPPRYRIPTPEELLTIQTYRDCESGELMRFCDSPFYAKSLGAYGFSEESGAHRYPESEPNPPTFRGEWARRLESISDGFERRYQRVRYQEDRVIKALTNPIRPSRVIGFAQGILYRMADRLIGHK